MKSKKGVYVKIKKSYFDKCYIVEIGTAFETNVFAVDFVDLINLKNEIQAIEDEAKTKERDL